MVNTYLIREPRTSNGENLFNQWCWENWINTCGKMKLDPYLTPLTKINPKWIKNLNIRPETVKLLEKTQGRILNIGLGNDFLDMTPKGQTTEEKKSISGITSNLTFCIIKETINKMKEQSMEENICKPCIS